jgi:hypothetical protein
MIYHSAVQYCDVTWGIEKLDDTIAIEESERIQ